MSEEPGTVAGSGWTEQEIEDLSKHIRNPHLHTIMPNLEAWVS